jgi:hypothetical protein
MVIIVSKNNKNAKKIDKTGVPSESYLQEYIHDNPEAIPIYEIDKNKRLIVVSREYPTNSGPIDALAFDQDGDIYIVETKLYKNTDKRRVIAQMLDYGAALWKHSNNYEHFIELIEKNFEDESSLETKIQTFYELTDEEMYELNNAIIMNYERGDFKFIVLMDQIEDRLKDLIQYVNKTSNFDIYPVELEFYKHEDYEIIVPRIFGTLVKKNTPKPYKGGISQEEFYSKLDKNGTVFFDALLSSAKEQGHEIRWATRGVHLHVEVNGKKIPFCSGNLRRNAVGQTVVTPYNNILTGVEDTELLLSYRQKFLDTGLFNPSGSKQEVKWVIDSDGGDKLSSVVELYMKLAETMKKTKYKTKDKK